MCPSVQLSATEILHLDTFLLPWRCKTMQTYQSSSIRLVEVKGNTDHQDEFSATPVTCLTSCLLFQEQSAPSSGSSTYHSFFFYFLSSRLRWQICLQLGVISPNSPPASREMNSLASGSFFCPALVDPPAREKRVIYFCKKRSAELLSAPDVFYFITENWKPAAFILLGFWLS